MTSFLDDQYVTESLVLVLTTLMVRLVELELKMPDCRQREDLASDAGSEETATRTKTKTVVVVVVVVVDENILRAKIPNCHFMSSLNKN